MHASTDIKRADTPRDGKASLVPCSRWDGGSFGIFCSDDGSQEWYRGAKWYYERRVSTSGDSGYKHRRDKGDGWSGERHIEPLVYGNSYFKIDGFYDGVPYGKWEITRRNLETEGRRRGERRQI